MSKGPSLGGALLGALGALAMLFGFGWLWWKTDKKERNRAIELDNSKQVKSWHGKNLMDKESYEELEEYMRPFLDDNEVYEKDLPAPARSSSRKLPCVKCHGYGVRHSGDKEYVCSTCSGSGMMTVVRSTKDGLFHITSN